MHRFNSAIYLALAASFLCTACVGNVSGPAEEAKLADKELVSDVKLEKGEIVATGSAMAKASAR